MNKFKKLLKAIKLIIQKPALLNKVLDDENIHKSEVIKKYDLPKGLKTVDINQLIPGLNETVEPYASLDGGSTPIDIALLKGLARTKPNCNYLEIGTWRGESVANVASVANHCVTLNLPDIEMQQMGLDKNYIASHRFFSKNLKNVTHIQANSQTFDFSSLDQKFDLIFVDGDHHYESVKNDTSNVFKLLNDENSIIVWHDYGNNQDDVRWDVLHGILDGAPADKYPFLYKVSNTLCAIYSRKTIESNYIQPYLSFKNYFSLIVKNKQV